ncbi:hypothetical protein Q3O60_15840 [Alkalimonas collagenimarina]|uniref:HDOD domain-containing protein n=1 Tax=Alkalimonas collagenimarina TaxID=400390 RepID=A0ABT9H2Y0_9GAMM|nr:hypothetical protein [Alkalimonas collagenimarina]MDP4537658.1 hypothetical protein [Alkalimonas collagenimarina]
MLIKAPLHDQANLLLLQREQMSRSRYVGLQQLQHIDQRLIAHLRILQQAREPVESPDTPWLHWLLHPKEALPVLLSFDFTPAHQAYLWQLKAYFHQFSATASVVQYVNTAPDFEAVWSLAKHSPEHFQFVLEQLPLAQAPAWFLSAFRQQTKVALPLDKGVTQSSDVHIACLQDSNIDPLALAEPLVMQGQLGLLELGFLMMQAIPQQKQALINLLSKQQDLTMVMYAMALCGQQKYLPLLVDLAQDPQWSETAAESLTIMLGVLAADSVIADGLSASDPAYMKHAFQSSGATWAQAITPPHQLQQLWQHGNQIQRQLAAIKASLQCSTLPLLNESGLWGGAWHTALT